MSKKGWIIFVALCVGFLGFLVWSSNQDKLDVTDINADKIQPALPENGEIAEHVYGKKDSKVVVIEYADFQCPGCASAYPMVKEVKEKYKDKIAFVFRNFPLTDAHPNALTAATVVEAAGQQGKYWEMLDKMFLNQAAWKNLSGTERAPFFEGYARDLKLDVDKFKEDVGSSNISRKIRFDSTLGKVKHKVPGTPSFYLNGNVLESEKWGDVESFSKTIDEELKKQEALQK